MNRRTILPLVLVSTVVLVAVLTGCASTTPSQESPDQGTPSEQQAPSEEQTPTEQQVETMNWRLQSHASPGHYEYDYMVKALDFINATSGGRLHIDPLPAGSVAPATDEFNGLNDGVIEMAQTGHHNNDDLIAHTGLFDTMSGGLTGVQMMLWYSAGGGDELAKDWYESKLNISYISSGIIGPEEVWLSSSVPLETPADIDGLKIRTAGDCGEILSRMGAATVHMPSGEIYEAAQRGVIDAFDYGSLTLNWELSFNEVCDYMYLSPSRAPTTSTCIAAYRPAWEKLSPDLQELVTYAFNDQTIPMYAWIITQQDVALQNFIDYGIDVERLPTSIDDAFKAEAAAFYDEVAAEAPEAGTVIQSMRDFIALCQAQGIQ